MHSVSEAYEADVMRERSIPHTLTHAACFVKEHDSNYLAHSGCEADVMRERSVTMPHAAGFVKERGDSSQVSLMRERSMPHAAGFVKEESTGEDDWQRECGYSGYRCEDMSRSESMHMPSIPSMPCALKNMPLPYAHSGAPLHELTEHVPSPYKRRRLGEDGEA
jgi:hypothetical protein